MTGIRLARIALGLHLDDAAAFIAVSAAHLSRAETGAVALTREQIDGLARLYDVPSAALLGAEPLPVRAQPPRLRDQ